MALTVKLSSKRQATFPRKVCEALGVVPGDELILERLPGEEDGWALKPARKPDRQWFRALASYGAKSETHDLASIRKSISEGRRANPHR